jgi:uncharacterized membrane protein
VKRDEMVFSSTDMFRERELERGDDLIGFMSHFATFFLVHFECEKTNREREREMMMLRTTTLTTIQTTTRTIGGRQNRHRFFFTRSQNGAVSSSSSSSKSSSKTKTMIFSSSKSSDVEEQKLYRRTSLKSFTTSSSSFSRRRRRVTTAASSSSSESSETKVIPGDYRIGATLIAISLFLGPVCHLWFPQCAIHAILGGFLSLQASRVRFRFSETDLDVVFIQPGESDGEAAKAETDSSGDNKLQGGGANKWSFESVQNWEFWFPGFPVLVYYKENQTREEGQPHFFPIIMDGKKLYEEMLTKMPKSVNEKPNPSEWNLLTAFKSTPVGRNIIEQMSEEQVKWCEETVGLPYFDEKK